MEEIWVEKYRPQRLKDVIGQEEITKRLQAYAEARNVPHLMFAGPPGTGKTTSAIALAKELYGDAWRENFAELNASDERGINVVRGRIKDFARTAAVSRDVPFKVIFLDEADSLTNDAQAALRRTMEKYAGTCRFVLSCNYSSKIMEPIQSRCAVFRFRPLQKDDIKKFVRKVANAEKVEVDADGLEALLYVGQGDMRRVVNTLQVASAGGRKVTAEAVYTTTATARPEDVKEMLETALAGNFLGARDKLDELLLNYGLSGEDIVRQVHRTVFDLTVPDKVKVELVERVGETDFRLVEGANERIQIEALLARVALVGAGLKA
ncbi:MAG TPA: replication factor C small subunit [Candidatus Thermoplasmatota archaeon]|nr:replication factor C small subunit [Candidatus Thermoplasmatota archaeon]